MVNNRYRGGYPGRKSDGCWCVDTRWGGVGNLRCSIEFFQITLQYNTMLLKVNKSLNAWGQGCFTEVQDQSHSKSSLHFWKSCDAGHAKSLKMTGVNDAHGSGVVGSGPIMFISSGRESLV